MAWLDHQWICWLVAKFLDHWWNPPKRCCRWVICLFRCRQALECVVLGTSCKRRSPKGFAWICNVRTRHGPTSTHRKAAFLSCNFPAGHIAQSLLLWGLAIAEKSGVPETAILEGTSVVSSEMSSGSHVAPSSSERVRQPAASRFRGDVSPLVELTAAARSSRYAWSRILYLCRALSIFHKNDVVNS